MKQIFAFLCLLCCYFSAFAQENGFLLHDIRLPDEFSQQIIKWFEMDRSGMLWLVTGNGLYRYDGGEAIHLGADSYPKLPHAAINTVFADAHNNLWIGAKDGLTRLNLKTWSTKEIKTPIGAPSSSLYIRIVFEDKDGVVYAGSQDGKVYRVVNDSLVVLLDVNQDLPDLYDLPNIRFIMEPYTDQLWIGTSMGKIIRIKKNKDGSYSPPKYYGLKEFAGKQITGMTFSPEGKCFLAIEGLGLYCFNTLSGVFSKVGGKYEDLGVKGQVFMTPLNAHKTLLLTNTPEIGKQKLLIYDFDLNKVLEQDLPFPRDLESNHIVRFIHTGSKILLSLNDHLLELIPSRSPFRALMAEPKALNSFRAIYKEPGGKLYAGSYKDGFVRFDERTGDKMLIARKYVYCILPWSKDSLILSTEGDGLLWYEPRYNRLSKLEISSERLKGKPIGRYPTFLLRINENQLLVGTYERLYLVEPRMHSAQVVRGDQLFKTRILSLLKWKENYLIATENGILKWNSYTDSIMPFWSNHIDTGLHKIGVYGMAALGNQVWAGTDGKGILIFNEDGIIEDTLNSDKGLAANIVFTVTAAGDYVLAGTQNGLSVINKRTLGIKNYSKLDQLPANEFNSASSFQEGDTVYLGTVDGVIRFNTDKLEAVGPQKWRDSIYISNLTVSSSDGVIHHDYTLPYRKTNGLFIPARAQYFSLTFGSLDKAAKNVNYYYRLQRDHSWTLLGDSRKITFVGMSPGDYNLEMVVRLIDGTWSGVLLKVPIHIAPPYYQTIWFRILMGILIALGIWGFLKFRERQAAKERDLRLKIAGDLHDEVGSTLAGISMQADMILSGNSKNSKEYLQSIADDGRSAVQTMGDIVWSIDPRNDDSDSLLIRMERYGYKVFENSDITIIFHKEHLNEKQNIPQKVRQNVMLIFKEALTNIVKHAKASRIDVTFSTFQHNFKLTIADNGKGADGNTITAAQGGASGHGLRNMHMRASAIGAELSFPVVKEGFTIVLLVENGK